MYLVFGFSYMHFQVRQSFIQLRCKSESLLRGSVSPNNIQDPKEYPRSKRTVDLYTAQL